MGKIKIKETVDKEIFYHPCVKCGSDNINFDDCGYSSFNVAWGRCNDCGNKVTISPCDCFIKVERIINVWNEENDPAILKSKYEAEIEKYKELINNLPKI